jgi:hypothetical protein
VDAFAKQPIVIEADIDVLAQKMHATAECQLTNGTIY